MNADPLHRSATLALKGAVLAYAALSVVSLVILLFARPVSPAPSRLLCTVVGPPAWLVWGVHAWLPFAVGSLGVVCILGVSLFLWQRMRMGPALAVGVAAALAFWLASGWLAWVVTL